MGYQNILGRACTTTTIKVSSISLPQRLAGCNSSFIDVFLLVHCPLVMVYSELLPSLGVSNRCHISMVGICSRLLCGFFLGWNMGFLLTLQMSLGCSLNSARFSFLHMHRKYLQITYVASNLCYAWLELPTHSTTYLHCVASQDIHNADVDCTDRTPNIILTSGCTPYRLLPICLFEVLLLQVYVSLLTLM